MYKKLVAQLNKDFQLLGMQEVFLETANPQELVLQLEAILKKMMSSNFEDYLNLLYRVDVSENQLQMLSSANFESFAQQVGFLILRREFQKVWLKTNWAKNKPIKS